MAVVVGVRVEEEGRWSVVVLEPIISTGWMPDVCSTMGVVEAPEPRIRGVLGERVWPAIMNWDWEFVVRVCPSTTTGAGFGVSSRIGGEATGVVVTTAEP